VLFRGLTHDLLDYSLLGHSLSGGRSLCDRLLGHGSLLGCGLSDDFLLGRFSGAWHFVLSTFNKKMKKTHFFIT
jgi:hypothetical protein